MKPLLIVNIACILFIFFYFFLLTETIISSALFLKNFGVVVVNLKQ